MIFRMNVAWSKTTSILLEEFQISTTLGLGWPALDFDKMILVLEIGGTSVEQLSSPTASFFQLLIVLNPDKFH